MEDLVRARRAGPVVEVDPALKRRSFERLPAGGLSGRTRAMLKVEDGCVNFCTYCIIPYARGPVRSLPLQEAAQEAARLAAEGYRELVMTGIELSSWGADLRDGTELMDLIEAVCAAAPGLRVRLGSLEPRTITEEFCRRAASPTSTCPSRAGATPPCGGWGGNIPPAGIGRASPSCAPSLTGRGLPPT